MGGWLMFLSSKCCRYRVRASTRSNLDGVPRAPASLLAPAIHALAIHCRRVTAPLAVARIVANYQPRIMFTTSFALAAILQGTFAVQPEAPCPIAAPLRDLPWAQLNFLHTTDVHGWWGGHLQE